MSSLILLYELKIIQNFFGVFLQFQIGVDNDSAAHSAGAAQKAKLEGTAGEGFMGGRIVLLDNQAVQRFVLKSDSFSLVSVNNDLLGGRFLHLKAGSGGHLRDGVLAGIEPFALLAL